VLVSIRGLIQALGSPSAKYSVGTLVAIGIVVGEVGVPSFTFVIHETSTDEFCLVCHAQDIGLEMAGKVHNDNPVGYRVGCAECHLPRAFFPKVVAKAITGTKDIYHTILGTISTLEKFEARRMHMALATWEAMNENDSRECRFCHDQAKWDLEQQSENARKYHARSLAAGKTCINCHKGIAHNLPKGIDEDHQVEGLDF
jgi:cytochrome c-type protein NapC